MNLPRIVFVLGKGGVGRTTVATSLGLALAARGERTCVFGWTVADPIGPWFGLPAAGPMPQPLAPNLSIANYQLNETLELYFVHHLGLPRLYRHVINGAHVRKLIEAAPGIAEVFFVGHLWWLTTLAAKEANLCFDRVVVDAPATGHGASLLDLPAVLSSLAGGGLLGVETERVVAMMSDPEWTGAVVVALPEELSSEETLELVPRVTDRLRRRPLAAFVNRTVSGFFGGEDAALQPLRGALSPPSRAGLDTIVAELRSRLVYEAALRTSLANATQHGTLLLPEQLANDGPHAPADVARNLVAAVEPLLL